MSKIFFLITNYSNRGSNSVFTSSGTVREARTFRWRCLWLLAGRNSRQSSRKLWLSLLEVWAHRKWLQESCDHNRWRMRGCLLRIHVGLKINKYSIFVMLLSAEDRQTLLGSFFEQLSGRYPNNDSVKESNPLHIAQKANRRTTAPTMTNFLSTPSVFWQYNVFWK